MIFLAKVLYVAVTAVLVCKALKQAFCADEEESRIERAARRVLTKHGVKVGRGGVS